MTHDRSRRLGYYILKPDGTIDAKVFGKALSNECIAEFEAVIQVVLDLAPILRAFEIANLSHHELRATLQGVNNRLSNISVAPLGGIPLIHDLETEVQQRVMAFLSSAKSFLDHTEAILKRQYGGVSPEYQRFKTHTHGLYDKNFSYRFVNELRTYEPTCNAAYFNLQHDYAAYRWNRRTGLRKRIEVGSRSSIDIMDEVEARRKKGTGEATPTV